MTSTFLWATVYGDRGFDDGYKRRNPDTWAEIEEGLEDGSVIIKTGTCFNVAWEKPHGCDCEYCEQTETDSRFFDTKEEAEEFVKELKADIDCDGDIEIEDDVEYTKAIKQQPANEGLFAEAAAG